VTESLYAIDGLTVNLRKWEDQGWIGIKNTPYFKRAAYLLKHRIATTSFQWVKGHNGDEGNEGSNALAKEGANKEIPNMLELEVPKEYNLQGAKLATITQALAYKGIQERTSALIRPQAEINLQTAREAIAAHSNTLETDTAIWQSLRKKTLCLRVQQFLYKTMHGGMKVGTYWTHIQNYEGRQWCQACLTTEMMEHILVNCREGTTAQIWNLAREAWPHPPPLWPNISIGMILGCGSLSPPNQNEQQGDRQEQTNQRGQTRLLQILISEAAHLIWVLRCERVLQQERRHTRGEVKARWNQAINTRLSDDKINATRIKCEHTFTSLIKNTWGPVLMCHGQFHSAMLHGLCTAGGRLLLLLYQCPGPSNSLQLFSHLLFPVL
jgi:ribonuclease HI